jgi:hypothetical protein
MNIGHLPSDCAGESYASEQREAGSTSCGETLLRLLETQDRIVPLERLVGMADTSPNDSPGVS